jgi:hypothetical protein
METEAESLVAVGPGVAELAVEEASETLSNLT